MSRTMLIDASHPEETRVAVVDGTRLEELDFESAAKRQIRGNVYLARVTRVEPSLQAAFVEFGGNRHGFLAFSEIHPDYYQIPVEDRAALIKAEQAENLQEEAEAEDALEKKKSVAKKTRKGKSVSKDADDDNDDTESENENKDNAEDNTTNKKSREAKTSDNDDDGGVADAVDEEVEEEQAQQLDKRRKRMSKRRYKIQEVIKRGQILLIQAVKEERGNKGAAVTTYMSLAGRYCVLMPNTPRGGGISRKISNGSDRKRLKSVMSELSVPQGMGLIVRTAGAKRTKAEIKRDFVYLSKLWDTVRNTTMESVAPALIHEEANLVKRSIRDLYGKDIDKVYVQGDEGYRLAKEFIKLLMPSHAKNVQPYIDDIPLFLRYQVESQIEDCLEPIAQLKSGGYLVIHPTEALVSVDVNSGRSTKERNVERTAFKTNLEAAEEVARQMRLRDLAGLVVIDFIDMDQHRNNRAVENKMREALAQDRARVQMGRISQFGLMELSRQRRRRSLLEGSSASCEHCHGVGRKRSVESSALKAVRAIEEEGVRGRAARIRLKVTPDVVAYLFNEKRDLINAVETENGMFTEIVADDNMIRPAYEVEIIEKKLTNGTDPLEEIVKEHRKTANSRRSRNNQKQSNYNKSLQDKTNQEDGNNAEVDEVDKDETTKPSRSKRRRGRRGGKNRRPVNKDNNQSAEQNDVAKIDNNADNDSTDKPGGEKSETKKSGAKKPSRRPKRGAKKPTSKTEKSHGKQEEESVTEDAPIKTTRRRKPAAAKKHVTITEDTKDITTKEAKPDGKTPVKRAPAKKVATKKTPTKKSIAKSAANKESVAKKTATKKTTVKKPVAKETASKKANPKKEKPKEAESIKPADKKREEKQSKKTGWWQKRNPFG